MSDDKGVYDFKPGMTADQKRYTFMFVKEVKRVPPQAIFQWDGDLNDWVIVKRDSDDEYYVPKKRSNVNAPWKTISEVIVNEE